MAVKKKNDVKKEDPLALPPGTMVDVVSTKGDKVIVTPMPYGQAKGLTAKNGWKNQIYQQGYHSYKTTIKENGNNGTD